MGRMGRIFAGTVHISNVRTLLQRLIVEAGARSLPALGFPRRLLSSLSAVLCLTAPLMRIPAGAEPVHPVIGMYRIVQVEHGDTLHKIARRYDVNVHVLAALNQVGEGGLRT